MSQLDDSTHFVTLSWFIEKSSQAENQDLDIFQDPQNQLEARVILK